MKHQESFKVLKAKLKQLQQEKTKAVKNQEYVYAAQIRDKEKVIIEKLLLLRPPEPQLEELKNKIATIYENNFIDKAVYESNILIAEYALKVGTDYLIRGIELSTLVQFATKKSNQKKEHLEIVSEHLNQWVAVMEEMPSGDFDFDSIEIKIKILIEFRYEQLRKLIKREIK